MHVCGSSCVRTSENVIVQCIFPIFYYCYFLYQPQVCTFSNIKFYHIILFSCHAIRCLACANIGEFEAKFSTSCIPLYAYKIVKIHALLYW